MLTEGAAIVSGEVAQIAESAGDGDRRYTGCRVGARQHRPRLAQANLLDEGHRGDTAALLERLEQASRTRVCNESHGLAHGFDEFFGSLYHLNAEDEPENPDYPKDPAFRQKFGPRCVLHTYADGRIENTGPLTRKRMETIDQEVTDAAIDFLKRAKEQDKPFFLWWNSTRMHIWTRLKAESQGKTGLGIYPDGMVEHDGQVGEMLKALDDLGLAENTIVMYSTDNGAEKFTWPDGGQSPFRGEKNTNWEGGYRVPSMVRWPGVIKPGTIYNDIIAHEDWIPTLVAAAGEPEIKEKLLKGYTVGAKTFKVHLDGYNITDYLSGKGEDPRKEFIYFVDDGSLVGLRYLQWKVVFAEQREEGLNVWQKPFVPLRLPKLFNLRSDPFETADHEGMDYERWRVEHLFVVVPAQAYVAKFLETFKEYPPRQKPGSFSIDQVMDNMKSAAAGGGKLGQFSTDHTAVGHSQARQRRPAVRLGPAMGER